MENERKIKNNNDSFIDQINDDFKEAEELLDSFPSYSIVACGAICENIILYYYACCYGNKRGLSTDGIYNSKKLEDSLKNDINGDNEEKNIIVASLLIKINELRVCRNRVLHKGVKYDKEFAKEKIDNLQSIMSLIIPLLSHDTIGIKFDTNNLKSKMGKIILKELASESNDNYISQNELYYTNQLFELAQSGDNISQNEIGKCLLFGYGIKKNYKKAKMWFYRAVEGNCNDSLYYLGYIYENGLGVEKKYSDAIYWYVLAAEKNDTRAMNRIGEMLIRGKGLNSNQFEGEKWLLKSVKNNNPEALEILCNYYYENDENEKIIKILYSLIEDDNTEAMWKLGYYLSISNERNDNKDAIIWLEKASKHGSIRAMIYLGDCYFLGVGVLKDYSRGAEYYLSAANMGSAEAQYKLGVCYYDGLGVKKDYRKGMELLQNSAEKGNSDAQYKLGRISVGMKSIEWFQKSAKQGNSLAQCEMGNNYLQGRYVVQDYDIAFKWFKSAAKQGNAEAQYKLAHCYSEGKGTISNPQMAFYWWKKSAEQGYMWALISLSQCYKEGIGVKKDDNKSNELFRLFKDRFGEYAKAWKSYYNKFYSKYYSGQKNTIEKKVTGDNQE